jgi:hypothetical protein
MDGIGYTPEEEEEMVGTLVKCRCGREFFLSFTKGLVCERCRRLNITKIDDKIEEHIKAYREKWRVKNEESQGREANTSRDREN